MTDFTGDEALEPVHQAMGSVMAVMDKTHAVTTAQLTGDGNRILMGYLPVGAALTGRGNFNADDLDSVSDLAIVVGTDGDPNLLLLSNTTVGQAAGSAALDGIALTATSRTVMSGESQTPIYVTFVTDSATAVAGDIRLVVEFYDKRS